ncbi:hypothetical protein FOZ63_014433 [Perkinsus olseni]|uniref:Uncharacterized protein n=1 Tax=Perkinsus olseni TaxID=32597 RepID=A0A7J6RSU6_PEROL|nr:hypothetical protein FOZ62_005892 [Perkinsus olseni]KAF4723829.1 hypothetical protein FOZ63_014433 [Perkinsus olseni]
MISNFILFASTVGSVASSTARIVDERTLRDEGIMVSPTERLECAFYQSEPFLSYTVKIDERDGFATSWLEDAAHDYSYTVEFTDENVLLIVAKVGSWTRSGRTRRREKMQRFSPWRMLSETSKEILMGNALKNSTDVHTNLKRCINVAGELIDNPPGKYVGRFRGLSWLTAFYEGVRDGMLHEIDKIKRKKERKEASRSSHKRKMRDEEDGERKRPRRH